MQTYEPGPGEHVGQAAARLVAMTAKGEPATMTFNQIEIVAQPGDAAGDLVARYDAECARRAKEYNESPQRAVEAAERAAKYRRKMDAAIDLARTGDEAALREAADPWPQNAADLAAYVDALATRSHGYGTSAYAMSLAAVAAFNYMAHTLGCTGFQASCADLDIIRRTRSYKGPFMIVDGCNLLYPQYDVIGRVCEAVAKWRAEWAPAEAAKLLAKSEHACESVRAHWRGLAGLPADPTAEKD